MNVFRTTAEPDRGAPAAGRQPGARQDGEVPETGGDGRRHAQDRAAAWRGAFLQLRRGGVKKGESIMLIVSRWGRPARPAIVAFAFALASGATSAQTRSNPNCPVETVFYDPGHGEDIVVPKGFEASVFAKDLNFPTGIAVSGDSKHFQVFVIESGKGLPSGFNEATDCNSNDKATVGGSTSQTNPFTPDLLVFNEKGNKIPGRLGKRNAAGRPSFRRTARLSVSASRMDSLAPPCSHRIRPRGCVGRRAARATTPRA